MTFPEMLNIGLMQGFAGLSLFAVLLLMGLGLAIIFGQMGVINMAHGEFMTIGAYTIYMGSTLAANYAPWIQQYAPPPYAGMPITTPDNPKMLYPGGAGGMDLAWFIGVLSAILIAVGVRMSVKRAKYCRVPPVYAADASPRKARTETR